MKRSQRANQVDQRRRRLLKHILGIGALAGVAPSLPAFAGEGRQPSRSPLQNRSPLAPSAMMPLPLGSIRPTGWLRDQMKIQANGLGGHLDEVWGDVGPNSGWLGGAGESWERGPYFLDGLVPLAWQLDDQRLKRKAQPYLDWTLSSQTPIGMFGPKSNNDWWPRMVMVKVLAQYEEATGDPRVLPFLSRYFAHQLAALPTRPLRDWGKFRWQDNALVVLWLYNRTGDPKLIELAKLLHAQGFDWQADFADFKYKAPITREFIKLNEDKSGLNDLALATHGVNNGQAIKASPVWSLLSGSETDRRAVLHQIAELDRYHGLPNGMFSCDEHLAGRNPSQGSELCTVVETMFSLEQSLAILGDPALGDRLERIAYNALPGTFTDDMWGHQYNQEPNQVEVSLHSKPWTTDGPESNIFGLEPNFGCCTANFHQGWPKLTASLWMLSHTGGLAATAYAPCELQTTVAGTPVTLTEETLYPFRGAIRIRVNPSKPLQFPVSLRIPAWAQGATLKVNGKPQPAPQPGTFAAIDRHWVAGDTIDLDLPMEPRTLKGFNDSVSIERGPLVFSYAIAGDWLKLRDRGQPSDWQIYPSSAWNYALSSGSGTGQIGTKEAPLSASPFSASGTPVTLSVKARKLPSWRAEDGVANTLPQSPVATTEPEETITLIPYGAAKLRITAFPQAKA
jgi:hypothetical protein